MSALNTTNTEAGLLLYYSGRNWGAHFREAGVVDGTAMLPFALEICDPNSENYRVWFPIFRKSTDRYFTKLMALTIASYLGLETVVQLLLEKGVEVESRSRNGRTPLFWAALYERGQWRIKAWDYKRVEW